MDHPEDVLGRAPLFEGLDEEGTKALRAGVTEVRLARGERLFDEGGDGHQLYVGLDGKTKLTRASAAGRADLTSLPRPGETFGEPCLFGPRPPPSGAVG